MDNGRSRALLRTIEAAAYWAVVAPALARLPAFIGYRVARARGDLLCRVQSDKRTELEHNIRLVLAGTVSPPTAKQIAREWFRLSSCEAVDVKRLRRDGRPLRRLVEIRGSEHLEAALAAGKGAILCSAHFGSYDCCYSVLGASGFPITTVGRWQHHYTAGLSQAERWFWDLVYARPLRRHRQRPNIEPWIGRFDVAGRAATVLRANEVVTIAIDAPPLPSDEARAVEVPLLAGRARLLPGAAVLAQLTGAPVLMAFMRRSADYRHQVLQISAPVPMHGQPAAAFSRCAAGVSAAVAASPAHWRYWASTADLASLGVSHDDLGATQEGGRRHASGPVPVTQAAVLRASARGLQLAACRQTRTSASLASQLSTGSHATDYLMPRST